MRSRLVRGGPLGRLEAVSVIALVLAPTAAAAGARAKRFGPGRLALVTVSNPRPGLVSGGEVLVRVDVGRHINHAVYADDLVNSASLGLSTTPVIDQRLDLDFAGFGNDIHTTDWSFIIRARMLAANGTDGNQVIIENLPTAAEINAANTYELAEMDAWLTNIENDHSHHSAQRKVPTTGRPS